MKVVASSHVRNMQRSALISDNTARKFFEDFSRQTGLEWTSSHLNSLAAKFPAPLQKVTSELSRLGWKPLPPDTAESFLGGWGVFVGGSVYARSDGSWPLGVSSLGGLVTITLQEFDSIHDRDPRGVLAYWSKKFMPSGTEVTRGYATWIKKGGHGGANVLERVADKAKTLGFKELRGSPHSSPDGSVVGDADTYHMGDLTLRLSRDYGVTAAQNYFSATLSFTDPRDTP